MNDYATLNTIRNYRGRNKVSTNQNAGAAARLGRVQVAKFKRFGLGLVLVDNQGTDSRKLSRGRL